jgi:hypothetical protein
MPRFPPSRGGGLVAETRGVENAARGKWTVSNSETMI